MTETGPHIERYRRCSRSPQREISANIKVPAELQTLFDKTPLLNLEDPRFYRAFLSRLAQEIRPSDTVEWLWLKDIADQTWQISHYRRIVAALIDVGQREAIAEIFATAGSASNVYEKREARELADKWFDTKTKKEVETALKKYGLDADSIVAVSFSKRSAVLETAERLSAAAEIRRNNTLREIEDRRQRLGHALRQATGKIIEAELSISSRQEAAE